MGLSNEVSASKLLEAQAQIWNYACNYINSMSLKCAIQLGIPDTIHNHGQPMTLSNLVTALHIHPSKSHSIYRLMRILVHSGLFSQQKVGENDEQEGYSLTLASRLLLKDEPLRAAPLSLLVLEPSLITPWSCITSWFQNNDPTPFETEHGRSIWDFVAHEPTFNNIFFEAMHTDSKLIGRVLIEECKWVFEGLKSLVDVGGGSGTMAIAIADAFPNIKCTVFDLPHVVASFQGTNNLDFIEGDMFEAIPPANAILLKWILHDWKDDESVKILKLCREAICKDEEAAGKVIIIDMVLENQETDKETAETQLCFDLLMMVNVNGRERNEKEWNKLFLAAGFTHYKITPIMGLRSLIEVYP
ncbi:trans-resveratrol di-O-methyltransferase-like [Corylus avellana]|uniref:trans-resveratrol di-O-methyltransferase-like n=1 Tax=Corylus avellana TaxID=13451 RepID=UPI001E2071A1|nr:trans-resveratrol di-O-methyltransferase-like [Corylus avellana]